jgi:hypothetical protein
LTRQSIHSSQMLLAKKMDARVKPAHDQSWTTDAGMNDETRDGVRGVSPMMQLGEERKQ